MLSSCSVPPPAYQTRGGLCERIRWQRGRRASAAARRGATPARSPNEQEGKENGVRGPLALKLRPMRSMEVKEAARAMSAVTSVLQQRAAASIRREDGISTRAVGTTCSKAPLSSSGYGPGAAPSGKAARARSKNSQRARTMGFGGCHIGAPGSGEKKRNITALHSGVILHVKTDIPSTRSPSYYTV